MLLSSNCHHRGLTCHIQWVFHKGACVDFHFTCTWGIQGPRPASFKSLAVACELVPTQPGQPGAGPKELVLASSLGLDSFLFLVSKAAAERERLIFSAEHVQDLSDLFEEISCIFSYIPSPKGSSLALEQYLEECRGQYQESAFYIIKVK